jgi:hypothetical protein
MLALIEEAQMMGNKMEAGLGDKRDIENMSRKREELLAEICGLKEQRGALKPEDE